MLEEQSLEAIRSRGFVPFHGFNSEFNLVLIERSENDFLVNIRYQARDDFLPVSKFTSLLNRDWKWDIYWISLSISSLDLTVEPSSLLSSFIEFVRCRGRRLKKLRIAISFG